MEEKNQIADNHNIYPKVYLNGGVVESTFQLIDINNDILDFWLKPDGGERQHLRILMRKSGELK